MPNASRLVKAIILLPLWPLILAAKGGTSRSAASCNGRANLLFDWYQRDPLWLRMRRIERSHARQRLWYKQNPWVATRSGPMHGWFGLSYSAYLVLPRVILTSMPNDWQLKMKDLLDEMHDTLNFEGLHCDYTVQVRDEKGHFTKDPLADYRHAPTIPRKR